MWDIAKMRLHFIQKVDGGHTRNIASWYKLYVLNNASLKYDSMELQLRARTW